MSERDSPYSFKEMVDISLIEYKQLIVQRFAQMDKMKDEIDGLKLEMAVLKSRTAIISTGIAFVLSTVIPYLLKYMHFN